MNQIEFPLNLQGSPSTPTNQTKYQLLSCGSSIPGHSSPVQGMVQAPSQMQRTTTGWMNILFPLIFMLKLL